MKIALYLVISSLFVSLSACAPSTAEEVYSDYLSRIARTLDKESPEVSYTALSTFPSRRELKRPEPELKMDFLSFLRVDECNLQQLIAQRNSSLGKVMPDSQRLLYEHKLMQALAACLTTPDLEAESLTWMQNLLQAKRGAADSIFWNTVLASPEMGAFFSPSDDFLAVTDSQDQLAVQRALSQLMNMQSGLGQTDTLLREDSLESSYKTLSVDAYGAQLLQSAQLAKAWLQTGTALIHSALDERPVCPQNTMTRKGRIMQTILNKFFVAQIQPHLARIQRELQAITQQFDIVNIPSDQAAFRQYHQRYLSSQGLPAEYTQAIKKHVKAWQRLLKQCGAMPKR